MRTPYILQEAEVQTLLHGMVNYGPEETYNRMKEKAVKAMSDNEYMDEMFMDMYEAMLKRAREFNYDEEDNDGKELQVVLYKLASMLRKVAHDVYRMYLKEGKDRNSPRFLRLVSSNKGIFANL